MSTESSEPSPADAGKISQTDAVVLIESKGLYTMDVEGEKRYIMAFSDVDTAQKFAISAIVLHGMGDDEEDDLDGYDAPCVPAEAFAEAVKTVGRMTSADKRTPVETFYATDLMTWSVPLSELQSRCEDTGECIFLVRPNLPPRCSTRRAGGGGS
eukprot:jgi/Mesvir1/16084/Mv08378-RA.1